MVSEWNGFQLSVTCLLRTQGAARCGCRVGQCSRSPLGVMRQRLSVFHFLPEKSCTSRLMVSSYSSPVSPSFQKQSWSQSYMAAGPMNSVSMRSKSAVRQIERGSTPSQPPTDLMLRWTRRSTALLRKVWQSCMERSWLWSQPRGKRLTARWQLRRGSLNAPNTLTEQAKLPQLTAYSIAEHSFSSCSPPPSRKQTQTASSNQPASSWARFSRAAKSRASGERASSPRRQTAGRRDYSLVFQNQGAMAVPQKLCKQRQARMSPCFMRSQNCYSREWVSASCGEQSTSKWRKYFSLALRSWKFQLSLRPRARSKVTCRQFSFSAPFSARIQQYIIPPTPPTSHPTLYTPAPARSPLSPLPPAPSPGPSPLPGPPRPRCSSIDPEQEWGCCERGQGEWG